jgi:hypothetical protein
MNKYSLKIIDFINNIKSNVNLSEFSKIQNINTNNTLLVKIRNIIQDIKTQSDNNKNFIKINKKTSNLEKLHNDAYPFIYLFFKEYFNIIKSPSINNNDFNDFKDFVMWYNVNQHKIDYDMIHSNIKSNKKLVQMFNNLFQTGNNREHLHDILHKNTFVGLDTIHYSEITDLNKIEITLLDYDTEITIYSEKNCSEIHLNEIINNILIIFMIMYKINQEIIKTKITKGNKFNLNILLGKQRKYIYNTDNYSPININSGSCMRGVFVNVWREEELEKVLIHEILHYYKCDFHEYQNSYKELREYIGSIFDIEGDDKVNESLNEIMANCINMQYQSIKLHMSLDLIYTYEIYFSMFQIAKIITFYKGLNYDSIFKSTPNHIIFKQTTSVLSYYIIKGLLLFRINNTLDFLNENSLSFDNSAQIIAYKDFLKNIITDKSISPANIVNKFIEIIRNIDSNKFIYRTMRMTAIS